MPHAQFLGLAGSIVAMMALILFLVCAIRAAMREMARAAAEEAARRGGPAEKVQTPGHTGVDVTVAVCCLIMTVVVVYLL